MHWNGKFGYISRPFFNYFVYLGTNVNARSLVCFERPWNEKVWYITRPFGILCY
jgi:hypothetical protein